MPDTHEEMAGRLAATLAELHRVASVSERLCEAGRRMLGADGASMTLRTSGGLVLVVASTDDLATRIEGVQDVVGEGPSHQSFTDDVVQVLAYPTDDDRWPLMHEHGHDLDFRGTLITVPLRPPGTVIGTLTAYRRSGAEASDDPTAEFLSVALGTAVLHDPHLSGEGAQLPARWATRARIHQATGMIVSQTGMRPEDAVALLQGRAFADGATMEDMARAVVERRVSFRTTTEDG